MAEEAIIIFVETLKLLKLIYTHIHTRIYIYALFIYVKIFYFLIYIYIHSLYHLINKDNIRYFRKTQINFVLN